MIEPGCGNCDSTCEIHSELVDIEDLKGKIRELQQENANLKVSAEQVRRPDSINSHDFQFRSENWFSNQADPALSVLYLDRYLNFGLTAEELRSKKPIIGIAQSGSDLSPCNRYHLQTSKRVREGIRAAGAIPLEFPTHPIQESSRRPTATLDRNLSYLTLVEILHSYPLDGVVLLTGCDKTTPAALMAAATVVSSQGPTRILRMD